MRAAGPRPLFLLLRYPGDAPLRGTTVGGLESVDARPPGANSGSSWERDGELAKIAENGRSGLIQRPKVSSFVPVHVEEVNDLGGHQPIRIRWPGGVDIDVPALTSTRDITAVLHCVRDIVPLVDGAGR